MTELLPEGLTPEKLKKQGNCTNCNAALFGQRETPRKFCGGCMSDLYHEGYSLREIASKAGVSMQRVHILLTNAGIKMRPPFKGMRQSPEERVS